MLLVADKYQVGFDQPKLCAMYILKKLHGIAAVQTLSRLNRLCPPYDKQTFVLDFANDYAEIEKAFGQYYTSNILANKVTPSSVYALETAIDSYYILDPSDIDSFSNMFFAKEHDAKAKKQMTYYLQRAKHKIDELEEKPKLTCVTDIRHFIRFYEFLMQATCFEDVELHKKYNFLCNLMSFVKINQGGSGFSLDDKIKASGFYQKRSAEYIKPNLKPDPILRLPEADDIKLSEEKEELLSEIIREINSKTGKNYDNDVAVAAALQVRDLMKKSDELKIKAKNNSEEDFSLAYYSHIEDALIDGLSQNQDFFTLLLNNAELRNQVLGLFKSEIYNTLRNM